jgi:hypothetical protein
MNNYATNDLDNSGYDVGGPVTVLQNLVGTNWWTGWLSGLGGYISDNYQDAYPNN